ncbi:hypothetical protein [Sulfurimonas sp.]
MRLNNIDELLLETPGKKDTVLLNAIELQNYIRSNNSIARELKIKTKQIEDLMYRLELKSAKIASLELDGLATYTLDLSA